MNFLFFTYLMQKCNEICAPLALIVGMGQDSVWVRVAPATQQL